VAVTERPVVEAVVQAKSGSAVFSVAPPESLARQTACGLMMTETYAAWSVALSVFWASLIGRGVERAAQHSDGRSGGRGDDALGIGAALGHGNARSSQVSRSPETS
jgi:hypothetical protein